MYDHHKKAGNQGDMVKHVALIATLDTLLQGGKGWFTYAEPFSGYAFNPLAQAGEWRFGIGQLPSGDASTGNQHVLLWRRFWDHGLPLLGSVYPGSSSFALRLGRKHGRSVRSWLWDISPSVIYQLMVAYDGLDVSIIPRSAEVEEVAAVSPDLVVVDPPGVQSEKRQEYPPLEKLLGLAGAGDSALLWLPLVAGENSEEWRRTALDSGLRGTVVRWNPEASFFGCLLFYHLPTAVESALRKAVEGIVQEACWAVKEIEHLGSCGDGG
jgi:23S rRNA A2030 N6-methylase RlmJ